MTYRVQRSGGSGFVVVVGYVFLTAAADVVARCARRPRRRLTCYWASSGDMRYRGTTALRPYGGDDGPGDWSRDRAERRRRYARRVEQAAERCAYRAGVCACVWRGTGRRLAVSRPRARCTMCTAYIATAEQGRGGWRTRAHHRTHV